MPQFRKKPTVIIEAVQFQSPLGVTDAPYWLYDAIADGRVRKDGNTLKIATLEGEHTARLGDWIIQGVQGELYPCKPDIFAATYEPAEKASDA